MESFTLLRMRFFYSAIFLASLFGNYFYCHAQKPVVKPTVCILGGTPSSAKIVDEIPDELKTRYNFVSFNRPGFGGSSNGVLNKKKLFEMFEKEITDDFNNKYRPIF